jgi:hypothetical protein
MGRPPRPLALPPQAVPVKDTTVLLLAGPTFAVLVTAAIAGCWLFGSLPAHQIWCAGPAFVPAVVSVLGWLDLRRLDRGVR